MEIPIRHRKVLLQIKDVLKNPENKSFLIAGHLNPDGDTIGGTLALGSLLRRLDKKNIFLFNYHPVPAIYRFLGHYKKIKSAQETRRKFDVAIIIDCSDINRLGGMIEQTRKAKTTIKIDHHADNKKWADINWSAAEHSSVAEMIYLLFQSFKFRLNKEEAEDIYTGIVTDTYNFTQINTNPQSHFIAGELLKCGVNPVKIVKNVYGTKSLSILRLLAKTLESIKISKSGRVAYAVITKNIFKQTGAGPEDTEGVINYLGMVPGVYVWVLFKEVPNEKYVKAGFRSIENIDINKFAGEFGGGGHKNAAGCSLNMDINKAVRTIIPRIDGYLKKINA